MKKLSLDLNSLRVSTFEVMRETRGEGTVFGQATQGCPPACSSLCAYITQASCTHQIQCFPQCSAVCQYETQSCG